ncbi:MAG: hypothetical protein ACI4SF_12985 [Oscillospiraceae bacterium]
MKIIIEGSAKEISDLASSHDNGLRNFEMLKSSISAFFEDLASNSDNLRKPKSLEELMDIAEITADYLSSEKDDNEISEKRAEIIRFIRDLY